MNQHIIDTSMNMNQHIIDGIIYLGCCIVAAIYIIHLIKGDK